MGQAPKGVRKAASVVLEETSERGVVSPASSTEVFGVRAE